MNLASLVARNAARFPDKTAIADGTRLLLYADAWRQIEQLAAGLRAVGIRAGDRVGLALRDHVVHVLAHYAIARIGAVILPVDHRWTVMEKRRTVDAFGARLLLTDDDNIEGTPSLPVDSLYGDPQTLPPIDESADADLLISLSSGTTGRPTGALLSHANFLERFRAQWTAIGYGAGDTFALLTPLYFGAGRSFAMSMLAVGGSLRLAAPPHQPQDIVAVLNEPDITATFLPPTLLRRLLPLAPEDGLLFPDLRFLLVSGEPLYRDEALDCRARLSPCLYSYYASSEGGGISLLLPADFEHFADTVGRPMPGTEVEVVDDEDRPLAHGRVGRLRYRGPGVAGSKLDADGTSRSLGDGGWYYPGDLAEIGDDGYIRLRGRDRDVIIRGGVNIYPAEIESQLLAHEQVLECAVTGIPDAARGQVVVAFVVLRGQLSDQALSDFCEQRLAPYKRPQRFVRVDELPKRASGKVDKQALQAD